jgi:acyl-CoA synthetase (AMP-forming)/AMP-acid ligase II
VHLDLVLDMATSGHGDRIGFGSKAGGLSYSELSERVGRTAAVVVRSNVEHLVFLGANSAEFPVALFSAWRAGASVVPLNYRLSEEKLVSLVARLQRPLVVYDPQFANLVQRFVAPCLSTAELAAEASRTAPLVNALDPDPEAPALVLFTSGTTAEPKAAILRHKHLGSYVASTVEFSGASTDDASVVTVPPYHIAGVSNTVSNVYAGRRVVHVATFEPDAWLRLVAAEQVTHALLVPTMLSRLVEHLTVTAGVVPAALRAIAYGGSPMPKTVIEKALRLFPDVDFVNAYGLTETSSTIAVLGPEDHRKALDGDSRERMRLGSAGKSVPGVEFVIRDENGSTLPNGQVGELWVRGEQISGEYQDKGSAVDSGGWFPSRDRAWIDSDGYLFIEGRSDDTIIRGGENIAPAEIEETLRQHRAVIDAAVIGLPDPEWGQRLAAAIVLRTGHRVHVEELQEFVRVRLRSSKTPDDVRFVAELPMTDTGKLLRSAVALQFVKPDRPSAETIS